MEPASTFSPGRGILLCCSPESVFPIFTCERFFFHFMGVFPDLMWGPGTGMSYFVISGHTKHTGLDSYLYCLSSFRPWKVRLQSIEYEWWSGFRGLDTGFNDLMISFRFTNRLSLFFLGLRGVGADPGWQWVKAGYILDRSSVHPGHILRDHHSRSHSHLRAI